MVWFGLGTIAGSVAPDPSWNDKTGHQTRLTNLNLILIFDPVFLDYEPSATPSRAVFAVQLYVAD